MKNFIKNKGLGFYLEIICLVFAIIGLISYSIAGQDSYGFFATVDVLLVLGIVAGIVFCYKDFYNVGAMVVMALLGGAVGAFVFSRFMYYSHQFYGIASDPMTGAMIATTVAFIGMLVFGVAAAFFSFEKEEK